ncbi:SusC/RagA family TonB-linked outer membrane protein [Pedobacter metabolipauper]|uniref:TonB-linked SusC/RagA family outer membrane protein n=1 Tax=Pedobacter metabolipauper TaxID=425513 RepID=A0A4R6SXP5_9SPHI|nr:SusC/RagA family TonB-linked outer membrane protein [Pedobacter metabolipauper]TDQ10271.1 TonB-linked SusC/RagA family outer membrane protein [Pedobacter metabolipauper]
MYKNAFNLGMPFYGLPKKLLLIMKLTTFILIISLVQVSAKSFSQISLNENNKSIIEVLEKVKKQSGFVFLYDYNELKDVKVNVSVNNASISTALNSILKSLPLEYKMSGAKTIAIVVKEPSFIDRIIDRIAAIDVKGRIVNDKGEPLVGASVTVKGTNKSTKTNDKGEFYLPNVDDKATLQISYIGYGNLEIAGSADMGDLKLSEVNEDLKEIEINAGYYTVTDRERTGSISRVTSETIAKQPINNPLQALQGRVPGVVIEQTTGVPGGGFNVQIRGRSSINAAAVGNNPLYVIDGVNYPSSNISSPAASSALLNTIGVNPLSNINPYDIESIEILKDADATAIYGSRGANGVILITTKKGKSGDTRINMDITQGFNKVGHRLDLLNTEQYLEMRREAFKNDGLVPGALDYDVNGTWDSTKYTDWQKEIIGGTANTSNATLNISGGTQKSNYIIGVNYYREGTVFPGNFGLNRVSVHSNLNFGSANNRFYASFTSNYSRTKSNLLRNDLTGRILLSPNAPNLFDEYGNVNWANGAFNTNPAALLFRTYNSGTDNIIGNLNINYRIANNLVFKASVGYTNVRRNELAKIPLVAYAPSTAPTANSRISDFSNNFTSSLIAEPQLTYSMKLGLGELNALIGGSFQEDYRSISNIRGRGFTSDALMENIASASTLAANGVSYAQYRYVAVFARLNYNLQSKYLINLTARRDGSSRFGDGKQFANFGAIGAAWIFSEESTIKQRLSFLSLGKLRVSYGITGNDQIPDYGYLQLWSSQDSYQGVSTLSPSRIANRAFSWETNKKAEIALQLGFIQNRITLESSYYWNRSSNQLVPQSLPLSTGNGSIIANLPATVRNSGLEFFTNFKVLGTSEWEWTSGINLTIPKNKLISYPGGLANSGYASTYIVGEPLSINITYNIRGVNPETGLYDIQDVDGNGILNASDRYVAKFLGQKYYGGFQNTLRYREFTLDFLFSFNKQTGLDYKSSVVNPGYFDSSTNASVNQPVLVLERWQQPGNQTSAQKFSTTVSSLNSYSSLANTQGTFVTDASYIRLKNLSFSYKFPRKFLESLKIVDAKLSLQGQNIFTLTNYVGLDPETRTMSLPPLRALSLGLNLTF